MLQFPTSILWTASPTLNTGNTSEPEPMAERMTDNKPAPKSDFSQFLKKLSDSGDKVLKAGTEAAEFGTKVEAMLKANIKAARTGNIREIPKNMLAIATAYKALSPEAQALVRQHLDLQIKNIKEDPAGTILPVVRRMNDMMIDEILNEIYPEDGLAKAGLRFSLRTVNNSATRMLERSLSTRQENPK